MDESPPRPPGPGAPARQADLFRLLVEGVQEYAIFMLDPSGRVVSWNAGAERIKGYRAAEVLGRHFSIFYPPEDVRAGKPELALRRAAELGTSEDEGWRVRRDGTRFVANAVITALRDERGALTGYAKVTRDMTERRLGEEARRNLATAREAVRSRDEFLAVVSHELRTPLTCVQLVLQSLARATHVDQPVTRAQAEKLGQLAHHVARLSDLVHGLLEVGALTTGRLRMAPEPFDLADLVRQVVARFQPDARRRGAGISVSAPEPIPGRWDRRRLGDALAALVGNAVKFAGMAPIDVTASQEGDRAVVSVLDRGPGISAEDQGRVFEKFERAAPVVHYAGFGVGLWTARQIVDAHGGSIDVRSARGRGACFTMILPLRSPA